MGVIRWPHTTFEKYEKIINEATEDIAYTPDMQNNVAPAGYFRSIRRNKEYLERCIFLPYLNNQKDFSQQYKDRMINLNFLVAVKYLQDIVVFPNESENFGYYADETETTMIKMADTEEYKKDLFGIKTLNEAKKLVLLECDAGHISPSH
jgi:palmitoyl-protein thioesterase